MEPGDTTGVPDPNNSKDPDLYAVYSQQRELETEQSEDIATKARLYIAKKRDEIIVEIQAKFADTLTTYEAVKGYTDRSLLACTLSKGDMVQPALNLGGYFNGDGRMASCRMRVNFAEKAAWSYSFDPDTLRCSCCPTNHRVLGGDTATEGARRVAFLLCDQAGPPCLASTDKNYNCIPVMRRESGLLLELADDFLKLTNRVKVTPGSICLLSSATQLAAGSIESYIKDLVTASDWVQRRFHGEVELVPAPVFILNGSNSPQLHNNMQALLAWCRNAGSPADLLQLSGEAAMMVGMEAKSGPGMVHSPVWCRLPANMSGEGDLRPYYFSLGEELPSSTTRISVAQERKILACLKAELNEKRALNIGDLVADRTLSEAAAAAADRRKKFMVIGASNSEMLAAALERAGVKAGRVTTRNWKAADETVSVVEGHILRGISAEEPETVVYQMLDNLVFLGRRVDGTTELPKRSASGIYHVSGELIVVSKEVQYNLYKVVRPLLMAAGSRPLVIITPFPRYTDSPCCSDPGHVTNFKEEGFAEDIARQLGELRSNFRSFLFSDRIRRASTINPAPLLEEAIPGGNWADPVHPKPEIFDRLAELTLECAERLHGKRKLEEGSSMVRATRGGREGSSSSSGEWRGPSTRRGPSYPRGYAGRGRGNFGRGQRGGYGY